jgi:hypothetical protein
VTNIGEKGRSPRNINAVVLPWLGSRQLQFAARQHARGLQGTANPPGEASRELQV